MVKSGMYFIPFLNELASGKINLRRDKDNIEERLLKRSILREFKYGEIPDHFMLTKITQKVIVEDLENIIKKVVIPEKSDFAVISENQIDGSEENYIIPHEYYVVIDGEKKILEI